MLRKLRMKKSYIHEKDSSAEMNRSIVNHEKDEHGAELRILLAGPIPMPIGGISIHIDRLSYWLSTQGIKVDLIDEARHRKTGVYNIRSMRVLSYLRILRQCNVAHIHSAVHLFRILHIVACRLFGVHVIVTIHQHWEGTLVKLINRIFLALAHHVVLVNSEINNSLKLKDYKDLPAFLPPVSFRQALPEEIRCFISGARKLGCSILCGNAYQIRKYKGQDLYGLDLCVELIDHLTNRSDVEAAIVFIVSQDAGGNQLYVNAQKVIKERGLVDRFCLYNESVDFVTLMMQCDLVLRPTNTDGDSVTIREALYFGLPVIASDAVQRPPGTILFKNRDIKDFCSHTVDILRGGTDGHYEPRQRDYDTYFKEYLDLYLEVLNSGNRAK